MSYSNDFHRPSPDDFNKIIEEPENDFLDDNIIQNISEYLKNNGLDEFLKLDPEEEIQLDYNAEYIYGDQSDILKVLRDATLHEDVLLDEVAHRVKNLSNSLTYYNEYLLEDKLEIKAKKINSKKSEQKTLITENSESDISEGESDSDCSGNESEGYPSSADISDRIKQTGIKVPISSRSKKVVSDASMSKTIDGIMFVGFDNNELTELPGFQEAPQLLYSMSLKMGFKNSFMKYWGAIIRSEASCALLQDSFWWFYLKYFKKENLNLERDAFKYFCRLADSFTALFLSIDSSLRDRFFGLYADFLCQAVYMVFYRAFPDSRLHFGDNFKQILCDTIFEWILGIRAIPGSYKDWKINSETNIFNQKIEVKVSSTNQILSKISHLEKFLSKLGNKEEELRPASVEKSKSNAKSAASNKSITSNYDRNKPILQFYNKNPSHPVKEGAFVEKFNFNLKGQSVLVSHYLNMRNLQGPHILGPRIIRSQITEQPKPGDPTYKDIISQSMEKAKNLEKQFKDLARVNEQEIKKLQREQAQAQAETTRLKNINLEEEQKKKKLRERKLKKAMVKLNAVNNLKVTRPVPTAHQLRNNSLTSVSESDSNMNDSESSESVISEQNGSQTPTKELLSYRRRSQDLREEDEFEE